MAEKSKIEWTDATWTPIRARNLKTGKVGHHCEHATTGCEFCYAERINKRLGTGLPFKPGHLNARDIEIFLDEKMLLAPCRWRKPRQIFVCSMTDLFARFVTDAMIDKVFAVMALCHQHEFQVCTKRADRMLDYFNGNPQPRWMSWQSAIDPNASDDGWPDFPLPNVWLGVSAERQQEADERIPLLLQTPAAVRFISAEPLLGPIDLARIQTNEESLDVVRGQGSRHSWAKSIPITKLDWIIVGGESGPNARPMEKAWAESLRDQCEAAHVSFFMKQMARKAPIPPDLMVREFPG